jgi:hypothetical protein
MNFIVIMCHNEHTLESYEVNSEEGSGLVFYIYLQ